MKKKLKKLMSPLVAVTLVAGLLNVGYDKVGATEQEKLIGVNPISVEASENKAILSYEDDVVSKATIVAGDVSKTEEQTKIIPFSVDLELNNEQLDLIRDDLFSGMNIVYMCSFEKSKEYPIENGMTDKGDLLTGYGEDLGDYVITDEEDAIVVEMILDGKSIYDLQDIVCGCTFEFNASLDAKKNTKTDVIYTDEDNKFKIEYTYDEQLPTDTTTPYTITKDGSVKGNTIIYEIIARANEDGTSLSNKVISDVLPQSLDFVSGEVELFDENGLVETIELTGVEGDVIEYTVPYRDYAVKKAVITLNAVLTSDKYIEYVTNNENGVEVSNIVNLYDENTTNSPEKKLLAKAEDTSKMFEDTEFFAKAGSQLGYLGHSMEWTITGNTYFTYSEDVYVVDYIPNCKSHKFSEDKNITISYDKFSEHNYEGSLLNIGQFDGEEYSYDNMNVETIKGLNITEPSYYDYNGGQVLIIPLDEEALNSPFTIKYYTDIVDITDNLVEGKDISNSARIMWNSASCGDGIIGSIPFGTATVEKVLYFRAIKKSVNGNYDMDTQTVKFDISINECGNLLGVSDYTIVTDDLTDKGMEYTGNISAVLKEIGGDGTPNEVTLTKVDTEEECRSQVFTYSISNDNKVLHVNLGNVTDKQNYVITIETKVTSPEKLATQKTGLVLTNTASIEYGDQIREATASLEYANRWITKENVVGKYDYDLHGNKWKIVLNPHKLPLSNINITDVLPNDTESIVIDLVQINKKEYKLKQKIELSSNEKTGSFILDDVILTYTLGDGTVDFAIKSANADVDITTNRYDIYYTTILSESARINEDYVVNGVTTENKAILTGDIKGVAVNDGNVASIEVGSKQNVNLAPVTKLGKQTVYNSENGVFETDWVIEVNRDATNFASYTLKDVLADNLELYTDTLKVYKASVASDGTFTKLEEVDVNSLLELVNNYDRFSFKISDELARTPMIIEFRTALTKLDGVGEQTVHNEVTLEKDGKSMVLDENVKSESIFYSEFTSKGYAQGIRIKLKKNEVLSEETSKDNTQESTENVAETMPVVDNDKNGVLNENVNKKPEILATMEDNTNNNSKDTGVSGAGVIKTGDDSVSPIVFSFAAVISLGVIISLVTYMSNKKKKQIVK